MVKLRNAVVAAAPLREFARLESALTRMLSAVFQESCGITYHACSEIFSPECRWIVCRYEGAAEFGLCITTESKALSNAEFFSQLVRLGKYLHQMCPAAFSLAPEWKEPPLEQHLFEISTAAGIGAHVRLAFSPTAMVPGLFSRLGEIEEPRVWPSSRCSIEVAVDRNHLRSNFALRADVRIFLSNRKQFFEARMSRVQDSVQIFLEKEAGMHNSTENAVCNVTLSLGAIELTLDDLLRLRPGMCIEFDAPESFEGMLVVDGAPWLEARVALEDRLLKVTIQSAAKLDIAANTIDGQETSEQKLRLVG